MPATKTAKKREALGRQIEQVREDIDELTRAVAELASAEKSALKDRAMKGISDIGERGRRTMEIANERALNLEKHATDYVRQKPLQSMAFAAAVGVAIGWLSRER